MKKRFQHIVNVTLLLLIVLYSTPISFLHNCSRFNEHHASAVFENAHVECYLCDIQLTSFVPAFSQYTGTLTFVPFTYCDLALSNKLSAFNRLISNKGPPLFF